MDHWPLITLLVLVAALGAAAVYAVAQARAAERKTPPIGRFLEVDGARLHYLEQGQGDPVVLPHGNGGLIPSPDEENPSLANAASSALDPPGPLRPGRFRSLRLGIMRNEHRAEAEARRAATVPEQRRAHVLPRSDGAAQASVHSHDSMSAPH